jgi:hypothetical protein
LQFANLITGDAHVAQFAHASRDRVSEFVAGNNFVDDGARLIDGLSRVWRKKRSAAFGCDLAYLFKCQIVSVDV